MMQKHRSEWDVTTTEGREALERFLMERMGFQRKDGAWDHKDGGRVDEGWLFSGDGMVWAKVWAADRLGLVLNSETHPAGIGMGWGGIARCYHAVSGREIAFERAETEEEAVALALARALEEMGR